MESSDASSWFMNFETDYSSFLLDFEQLDQPVPSPMVPVDLSSLAPECLLSRSSSSSNPDQSPEVHAPTLPLESNLRNVDTDQGKKKSRTRNNRWNCRIAKGTKSTNKEASNTSDCTDSMNPSPKRGRGRKRSYEATIEDDSSADPPLQLEMHSKKDHVMAERRRREKLTRHFIALSSVVPGLTRMDKATVLEDATKLIKQLQEKVHMSETKSTQNVVHDAVIIQKSHSANGCNSPDEELSTKAGSVQIEVRISEQRVLTKIHCKNQKGILVKTLSEIESLGLIIVSTSVVPFTSSTFDITITAKVDDHELSLTAEDLVKRLNFALRQFQLL